MSKIVNILIDIGHPAHVHLFRYFIKEMEKAGHKIVVITKDVDSIVRLLNLFEIPYINIGRKSDSLIAKYFNQVVYILKTIFIVRKYKINIGIGISMTLPLVSKLTRITTFGMDDDDTAATPISAKFVNKADYILTPDCLAFEHRGKNHISYPAYHELAYLHPDRFTPDPQVLKEAGVKIGESFFVLRFNAFKAHHDTDAQGLNLFQKKQLVDLLVKYGRVFITSEKSIEPEFEHLRLPVAPDRIHSLLYYATLFAGDSQTMTSEAAVLGTPAFKCNTFAGKLSIPNEIENRYKLCFSYQPGSFNLMMEDIKKHLDMPDLKKVFAQRKELMLKDKIDLTAFLCDLINNFQESGGINKNSEN